MTVTAKAFTFKHRGGQYTNAVINVNGNNIEITASPTGRRVHIHVNGDLWQPKPTAEATA
jgi:hypothetical protein